MHILSSDYDTTLLKEMERFKMQGMFKSIITAVHDKSDSIQKIIKDNHYDPKKTVFIGDTAHEIEVGKRADALTALHNSQFKRIRTNNIRKVTESLLAESDSVT